MTNGFIDYKLALSMISMSGNKGVLVGRAPLRGFPGAPRRAESGKGMFEVWRWTGRVFWT